jgi:thiamine pyrophosphokinase
MKISEKVAIVLHGEYSKPDDLWAWSQEADMIIAADGAADTLLSLGIKPDVVIGDMDGIRSDTLAGLPEGAVVREEDHESTDFQKALRYAKDAAGARTVAVLAYEGSRVDHMLSGIFYASAFAELKVRFVGSKAQGHILHMGTHRLGAEVGIRLSIRPLRDALIPNATGLKYTLNGRTLSIGGKDGISNVAVSAEVSLNIADGTVIAFVQRFEGETRW